MTRKEAEVFISRIVKMRDYADDSLASRVVDLYPTLKEDGELVPAGTRINWNGQIKRNTVDIWDRTENNPDNAPTLWEDINYREGYRIIPEVITVSAVFAKDECGWWGDELYKSLIDNNTWTPAEYATGWTLVQ